MRLLLQPEEKSNWPAGIPGRAGPLALAITFVDTDAGAGVSAIGAGVIRSRRRISLSILSESALDHSQMIGDQTFYFSLSASRRRSL